MNFAYRLFLVLTIDLLLFLVSFLISIFFRYDNFYFNFDKLFLFYVVLNFSLILFFKVYKNSIKYVNFTTVVLPIIITFASTVFTILIKSIYFDLNSLPRGVYLINFCIYSFLLLSSRAIFGYIYFNIGTYKKSNNKKNVLIYGLEKKSLTLADFISSEYNVDLFYKNINYSKKVSSYNVIPISKINFSKYNCIYLDRVNLSNSDREFLSSYFLKNNVNHINDFPSSDNYNKKIDAVIDPIDLIGRDLIEPIKQLFIDEIINRKIMVTGAGGSIGSALSIQILSNLPSKLYLVDSSEYNLFKLMNNQLVKTSSTTVIPILCDISNLELLNKVMSDIDVEVIYHAAAYKHVNMVEHNSIAGLYNNILSTYNICNLALSKKIQKLVFVSTDKAVCPNNIMGFSKRICEKIVNYFNGNNLKTCIVRFGNVLGSSGSVVTIFKDQILSGGPVTVTDPSVTRYFMTIYEAVQLIIQAGALSKGGDVFILDMGQPVLIDQLAKKLITLMGCQYTNPTDPNYINIIYTGLSRGEKLHEILTKNNLFDTEHPRIKTDLNDDFNEGYSIDAILSYIESSNLELLKL
jgi:FlaA1/EpsC-like NDP-sugar epimerase